MVDLPGRAGNDRRMDRQEIWRLFVALKLPRSMGRYLAAQQARMWEHLPGDHVRWVRPEGIHLTLRFLGSVAPEAVASVAADMQNVAGDHRGLRMQPSGLGCFGRPQHLKAIWVGLGGQEEDLSRLVRDLNDALGASGFPAVEHPFRAHLTLGRVRERSSPAIRSALHGEVTRYLLPPAEAADFTAVQLIRSHLGPGGARYEVLQELDLVGMACS
jgi:2'-5' RNA ligase